jgi:hypothetical protein
MWIKPPSVYDVTIPSNHKIISRTKIVQSIEHLQFKPLRAARIWPKSEMAPVNAA